MSEPKKVSITIPTESYELIELKGNNLPAICLVNKSLVKFEHQDIFPWFCTLTLDLKDLDSKDMPTDSEKEVLNAFFNKLDAELKKDHNGLFVARVTWNKTQQLVWRLHDPVLADDFIQGIIESEDHPRSFDYAINNDPTWNKSKWLLDPLK